MAMATRARLLSRSAGALRRPAAAAAPSAPSLGAPFLAPAVLLAPVAVGSDRWGSEALGLAAVFAASAMLTMPAAADCKAAPPKLEEVVTPSGVTLPRCRVCRGYGAGLIHANGMCAHCGRTHKDVGKMSADLVEWLRATGSTVDGISVGESAIPGGGQGLVRASKRPMSWWLKPWGGEEVVAEFPKPEAIALESIIEHPTLGKVFWDLVEKKEVRDDQLPLLFLLVERARGGESPWAEYMAMLPKDFTTPIHLPVEVQFQLRGTTLHAATQSKIKGLRKDYDAAKPALERLLKEAGIAEDKLPTYDDYAWAFSAFTSRAIGIPMPNPHAGPGATIDDCPHVSTLVPGLDMANHKRGAPCRWAVAGVPGGVSGSDDKVYLLCNKGWRAPKQGGEIFISYGDDKSNEELLFLHGFVDEASGGRYEKLMVHCSLPEPSEWDEAIVMRVTALKDLDLSPKWFFSRAGLDAAKKSGKRAPAAAGLPPRCLEAAAVLAMRKVQLEAARADAIEANEGAAEGAEVQVMDPLADIRAQVQGLDLIEQLLAMKVAEMEAGTGTAAADAELLKRGGAAMTPAMRAIVVYRRDQKQLGRDWLEHVRALLARTAKEAGLDELVHA